MDDLIQIWSARIRLFEIEAVLARFSLHTYRLEMSENNGGEKLTIEIESDQEIQDFKLALYELNEDLKASIPYSQFERHVSVNWMRPGTIRRNERTGKISTITDLRY